MLIALVALCIQEMRPLEDPIDREAFCPYFTEPPRPRSRRTQNPGVSDGKRANVREGEGEITKPNNKKNVKLKRSRCNLTAA